MEQYFTAIAENEFKKDLFLHPLAYSIKPYQSMTDCLSTIISPIILPGYFLTLAIFSLIESILSTMYLCYLIISKSDTTQDITDHTSPAKIGFQMLCACLIIAPLMMVVFLLRLVSTLISEILNTVLSPLEEQRAVLKEKKLILEAIKKYSTLVASAKSEKNIILETLNSYSLEMNSCLSASTSTKQDNEREYRSCISSSYFQITDEQSVLLREQDINYEMLCSLNELIHYYPINSFNNSSKLNEIELAYTAFEEHHKKIVDLAEVILPSLLCVLNKTKKANNSMQII